MSSHWAIELCGYASILLCNVVRFIMEQICPANLHTGGLASDVYFCIIHVN